MESGIKPRSRSECRVLVIIPWLPPQLGFGQYYRIVFNKNALHVQEHIDLARWNMSGKPPVFPATVNLTVLVGYNKLKVYLIC